MSNALTKALTNADRSYFSAKQAVADRAAEQLLARGPSGLPFGDSSSLRNAKSQLDSFSNWVFAAVRPICNRIAAQPVGVGLYKTDRAAMMFKLLEKGMLPPISRLTLKTKGAGDVEPLDDHPVLDLLADPNDLQTSWGLLWSTVASINLCGRAFWWVTEGNEELHLLPTSWVLGSTGSTRFQSWKVQPPGHGETIEIPSERMVYFALPSPSDPWGSVSPLQTAAAAVDNDADILRSQRAAFHQGVYARHALIIGRQPVEGLSGGLRPRLTPTQHRQLINAVRKRYEGLANNEPLILDGLIEDVKTLTNSPHEMDWRESAESMKSRIMQAFGTSSYLVGGTEPGSRAASAVAETHFLNNTVNPIIRMMSEAMTEWLSPMFGGGLKIWVEPCVADDADLRIQWATLLSQNGSLSVHELRSLSPFGLSENNAFDNQLVGGENMKTLNPIQRGVERMVQNSVASLAADSGRFGDVLPALTFSGGNGDR